MERPTVIKENCSSPDVAGSISIPGITESKPLTKVLPASTAMSIPTSTSNDVLIIHSTEGKFCSLCTPTASTEAAVVNAANYVPITNAAFYIYNCEICDQTFSAKANFQSHYRAEHTAVKPFRCTFPGCGMPFSFHSDCVDHVRAVHFGANQAVYCDVYIFTDENALRREGLAADTKKFFIPQVVYHNVDGDGSNAASKAFRVFNTTFNHIFIPLTLSQVVIFAANHSACKMVSNDQQSASNLTQNNPTASVPKTIQALNLSSKQIFASLVSNSREGAASPPESLKAPTSATFRAQPSFTFGDDDEFPINLALNPKVPSTLATNSCSRISYRCPLSPCKKLFSDWRCLTQHHLSHVGELPFRCLFPACSRQFCWSSFARRHVREAHFRRRMISPEELAAYIEVDQQSLKIQSDYLSVLKTMKKDLEVYVD